MKCVRKWPCSGLQFATLNIAATLLTALLCQGCASQKSTQALRTMTQKEEFSLLYREALPAVEAQIALPIEQLKALPEGVEVTGQRKNIHAAVRRQQDTIYLSARSDSLPATIIAKSQNSSVEQTARQETYKARSHLHLFLHLLFVSVAFLLLICFMIYLHFSAKRK